MLSDLGGLPDLLLAPVPALLGLMALAAFLESALGLGALVPGESVVAIGAAAVATTAQGWVPLAVLVVTGAAVAGDHVGWWVGRRAGPPLERSALVRQIGVVHWSRAMAATERQSLLSLVLLRQLPGVRTLVSAACGAARVRYRRVLVMSVLGAAVWSMLWVAAGAVLGRRALDVVGPWLPLVLGVWILVVVASLLWGRWRRGQEESA